MKISIITTISNPWFRQDPWREALKSYLHLADEIIIVNGGDKLPFFDSIFEKDENRGKIKEVFLPWNNDWSWEELPKHLNCGLNEASGDWIIKLDIDQFIHEKDKEELRSRLEKIKEPVATFQKHTVLPSGKFEEKGEFPIAINAKYKDRIKFGEVKGKYTDLCLPIWADSINEKGVPEGREIREFGRTGLSYWNFDYFFKTKEVTEQLFLSMSLAHQRYFGTTSWGRTKEEALGVFLKNMKGRLDRSKDRAYSINDLPRVLHDSVRNLQPSQFGYNGWSLL